MSFERLDTVAPSFGFINGLYGNLVCDRRRCLRFRGSQIRKEKVEGFSNRLLAALVSKSMNLYRFLFIYTYSLSLYI